MVTETRIPKLGPKEMMLTLTHAFRAKQGADLTPGVEVTLTRGPGDEYLGNKGEPLVLDDRHAIIKIDYGPADGRKERRARYWNTLVELGRNRPISPRGEFV